MNPDMARCYPKHGEGIQIWHVAIRGMAGEFGNHRIRHIDCKERFQKDSVRSVICDIDMVGILNA